MRTVALATTTRLPIRIASSVHLLVVWGLADGLARQTAALAVTTSFEGAMEGLQMKEGYA